MMFYRFKKPGWVLVFIGLLFVVFRLFYSLFGQFEFSQDIVIQRGDTIAVFLRPLSSVERLRIKRYIHQHPTLLNTLQLGLYSFSGSYSPSSFLATINGGPKQSFQRVTVLEGWSIYDTDAMLSNKGLIIAGEYVAAVKDPILIQKLRTTYPFVDEFFRTKKLDVSDSLEGLLYPDTYHLDSDQSVIDQLIKMQLNAFRDKVAVPYQSQISSFSKLLNSQGYSFGLGLYNIITLASIIEKEERSITNKPTIAGIFLNRIQNNMRLDADITLCYGLHQGYEGCTPDIIAHSLQDATNLYNTRVHSGLTPGPISSPSVYTLSALLGFKKTEYLFYLHDASAKIWYAKDIQEHNINKSKYL